MGMTGEQAYVLSKKYTEETAIGMGAIKGDKGDPGKSSYELAKDNGFIGTETEYLESLKGKDGVSPTITENADNTDKIYKLDITTADSSFTTPNLKGADGTGGTGASTWSEISDKPFESLSTDFSVENGELKVVGGTGGSGEENTIESISVNGTPISPDGNKNVNITMPDAYDDTALSNRVKTIEDDYAKSSEIPSLSGYATESYVTEQISNIPSVDLTDYATKTYVGEQITNAEHLKREIVTVLPSDAEASDNIIYMLKVESATGNDKYQEYMKIDGTVKMIGDTSVDLTDYAKIADIPTSLPANGGNSDTVNNHTVESNVPTDAKFTDTIYDDTAVKGSIEELNESLSVIGKCKNLLNPTLKTTTQKGVTCTANGDGTYTLNGTASEGTNFFVGEIKLDSSLTSYKLSGCPLGGSWDNGYSMYVENQYWGVDSGEGSKINLVDDSKVSTIFIRVHGNVVCDNIVFKPMITTDLTATYDDFVPYTGDGDTLTHDVAELKNDLANDSVNVVVNNASGANILDKLNMKGKSFIATVTDEGNRNNYIVFIGNYAIDANPILNVISSNVLTKGSVNKFGTVEINGSSTSNVRWKAREL